MPSKIDEVVVAWQHSLINEALGECTPDQQAFFIRIFGAVEEITSEEDIRSAYGLIERTLADNAKKAGE